jgi:4-diphosphocytidyl-2-C-methyl-D-erythritol kinase
MGGGSSDGAYMIRAINELCSLGMSTEEMQDFAIQLGADCPFFITSQTAYAEGKGEVLTPFASNDSVLNGEYFLVLIKPDVAVSTKEAYAGINPHAPKFNCKDIVQNTPITQWRDTLHNDFEDSIFLKLPILGEVKQALYDSGAVYASMSGSGSTVYGIFPNSTNENELKENSKITQYASKYYFKILKKK